MKRKKLSVSFLVALISLNCLAITSGIAATSPACKEDVQHAADLAAIEKRLHTLHQDKVKELNSEEQKWYTTFQKGGLLFDGWQDISEDVVAKVPEDEKFKTKVTMEILGVKIGSEWCKDNTIRRISTDKLKQWGKQLRRAVASSSTQIPAVLNSIEYEVDELLSFN